MPSIDKAGISLTVFEIKADKWLDYLNYTVNTIAWQKGKNNGINY